MDSTPLRKQPILAAALAFGSVAAVYYWLASSAGSEAIPSSIFSDVILVMGILILLGITLFTLQLLMNAATDTRLAIGIFLRLIVLFTWFLLHIPLYLPGGTELALRGVLVDLDFMLMVTLLLTAFSAQFVLPVQTGSERWAVARRLFGYILGERGPITYIREGHAVEAHEESLRTGPGVFLVDSSSAVVLRTDVAFTRACGPGVVFTSPGERRAEALDLRRQIRRVEGENLPSGSPSGSDQTDSVALTQDGIPISADISVTFMLDPGHREPPREGGDPRLPPYEFSRGAAERAVYGHVYSEVEDIPWTKLPLILVIDIWRELVKSRRLEALLTSDEQTLNPLELLQKDIMDRLTTGGTSANEPGSARISREAEILSSRGIRLLEVKISNLQLPPEIQAERNLQWRERWGGNLATAKTRSIENLRAEGRLGESIADSTLLTALSKSVREELHNDLKPGRRATLLSIFSDASKLSRQIGNDPEGVLNHRLEDCLSSIAALDPDCGPPSPKDPV